MTGEQKIGLVLEHILLRLDDMDAGIKGVTASNRQLASAVGQLEVAVVELSREVHGLRKDLREEEMARRAVAITVMDHEAKLSALQGGRTKPNGR